MYAKDLIGKKIIDKKAKDLAKLTEIEFDTKTFIISNIYGSIGNPLSKKYFDIPVEAIVAVGDYIQISKTFEELEGSKLDKIPETGEDRIKLNNLIGKTVISSEAYIVGKISNVELNVDTFKIDELLLSGSSSSFGLSKSQKSINQNDITNIGDYIILNKDFVEEETEDEEDQNQDKKEESFNINVE